VWLPTIRFAALCFDLTCALDILAQCVRPNFWRKPEADHFSLLC
jgi:hypothetical protein